MSIWFTIHLSPSIVVEILVAAATAPHNSDMIAIHETDLHLHASIGLNLSYTCTHLFVWQCTTYRHSHKSTNTRSGRAILHMQNQYINQLTFNIALLNFCLQLNTEREGKKMKKTYLKMWANLSVLCVCVSVSVLNWIDPSWFVLMKEMKRKEDETQDKIVKTCCRVIRRWWWWS